MCEKCLYRKNCQFLAKQKPCKVEGCTAFKSEKELIADTVRKMQTLIEEKADSCDICLINSHKPIDIIYQISKKQLDQIAKEMLEGENSQERLRNERNTTK